MRKIWNVKKCDAEQAAALAAETGISTLLAGVLLNRGIDNREKVEEFLHPEKWDYHDPYLLPDMAAAVKRIRQAIDSREQIVVYGDYDADGITATTILLKCLKKMGAFVDYYIPNRFTEGYGINQEALEKLYNLGISLIITVDCGIKSLQEIESMSGKIDFIVTDHHLPGEELPKAVAVVDAHRQDSVYPCKELAGVGIAFKLCQALGKEMANPACEEAALEIVALGTVADAVPLVDENRKIVAAGLKRMSTTQSVGLKALIDITGLAGRDIDSTAIGFILAPRINVAGRLESARLSVELLLCQDSEQAAQMAERLNELNHTRKELKNRIQAAAEEQLAKVDMDNARVIVVAGQGWHHGVLGLVASSLQEKYYLPTVVISIKDGIGKGSCRSIPGFNLFEALGNCQQHLLQFGGHAMAAGLTVAENQIDAFREALSKETLRQMEPEQFIPSFNIDMEISPGDMTMSMVEELSLLEPCGMANESPLFACKGLRGVNGELKGTDANHLKFSVADKGHLVEAIAFNMPEMLNKVNQSRFDMVYAVGINEWRDMRNLQCVVRCLESPVPAQREMQPNREFLKGIYGFLLGRVKSGRKMSSDLTWVAMQARGQGCRATLENVEAALQIFLELGLLVDDGKGYLELNQSSGPMKLEDSPTYRQLNGLEN